MRTPKTKRRWRNLMNSMCWKSPGRYMTSYVRTTKMSFLNWRRSGIRRPSRTGKEPPDLAWLLALLAGYNAVTKVIYDNDADRKMHYTIEGINSSTAKVTEFRRGLHYWADLTATYGDIVTDESTLKAYRDAGVKRFAG